MKLTHQQIDQLYLFTRQHYVEYYDLQTELVDHLANAIETEWEQNPRPTFDEVLHKEFRKFGVFGFMDVVESRQVVLGKKYNRIVWSHFKGFFTIPKIILTGFLILAVFYFLKEYYTKEIFTATMLFLISSMLPFLFFENRKMKKRKQETGKIWLFEKILSNYGTFPWLMILPIHFFNIIRIDRISNPSDLVLFCMSLFIVSMSLAIFIVLKIIPSKAEAYLKQTYPEYKLENL
ncbi:hypothetical protein EKL98_01420 [Flavobacterium bomense]|uniref:Uncharacterized protein n=1 Tax=Flavobacterium bomense TaxID=2497483 RepID=A0A3S0V0E1_9FLAO|nr:MULTISPECIES: hypothetical protein [Flavobacterium]RTY92659.1 hypothetical protein EKM01_00685 [Flavobacterium sp. RSP46]RTZ08006.1 hypothetical protein EKL98_01420 [Flavobacterium bomense]